MSIDWSEIRAWAQFLVIVVGGVVALSTYLVNQRQRRFENGLRLVAAFRASISASDLLAWKTVVQESMRPPYTHDVLTDTAGLEYPFGKLLKGGGSDNGATSRILDELNALSHEFLNGYADLRDFYFELGEVIGSICGTPLNPDLQRTAAMPLRPILVGRLGNTSGVLLKACKRPEGLRRLHDLLCA